MYSIQALWSAVQLKLAMTFVILNNRRYAALQEFAPTFGFAAGARLEGTDLSGLDFVAMARGMGVVDAVRIDRPENLRASLEAALRSSAPALVEIVVA
jgi:benzoylformate decarboxylase